MSLQANKKSIAAFVAGAAALGFVMTFSFGGRQAFIKHESFLCYFDGSVNGLDTTSLVKFRGVPIGYVDTLKIKYEQPRYDHRIPVFIKVDMERVQRQLNLTADLADPAILEQQIRAGLRAKLEVDSYVTGKLYVDLGYYPNAPKPPLVATETDLAVIPTIPSNSSELISRVVAWTNMIGKFDFKGLERAIDDKLDEATAKVDGIPFAAMNQKLLDILAPIEALDGRALHARLNDALAQLQRYGTMANVPNTQVVKQSANLLGLTTHARTTIDSFQDQIKALRTTLEVEGELRQQLDEMLIKVDGMASSLKQQANNLEEHPQM